jgi:WXXGXW repeat (2 copies)
MSSSTGRLRILGASVVLLASLACAHGMSVGVSFANHQPPADRVEVAVASPGAGYVYIRGHWGWGSNDYNWIPGRWERVQRGYRTWVPGHWVQRRGHRWYWVEGHWAR